MRGVFFMIIIRIDVCYGVVIGCHRGGVGGALG